MYGKILAEVTDEGEDKDDAPLIPYVQFCTEQLHLV